MKLYLLPNWASKKGQTEVSKEDLVYSGKVLVMLVIAFVYLAIALQVDTYYVRGSLITFIFAALWLPIRWDAHMPAKYRKESWADKNVHS